MRERWFGATRLRVPAIAAEGDPRVPVERAVVLEDVADEARLAELHEQGVPVVVRAATADGVKEALRRPEVACVLVPADRADLLELDLTELTYG